MRNEATRTAIVRRTSRSHQNMSVYQCQHCCFRCSVWRKLVRHTFECHACVPGFSFKCCLNGCARTFKTHSAISSHINRDHKPSDRPEMDQPSDPVPLSPPVDDPVIPPEYDELPDDCSLESEPEIERMDTGDECCRRQLPGFS